ncbi:hypothetical protein BCR34DRAFT_604537 [Clohesyomyces aquaticus]|uniref:Uncharacterized protein n=1 Tax=Clohesyomyces aquaticus TaxID=1231657 RepID=A0A1Y1Z561_9PLEO|nr:hypothetical protein BCR34DRAFT_604537 [Clohesyomyces aquaticus]
MVLSGLLAVSLVGISKLPVRKPIRPAKGNKAALAPTAGDSKIMISNFPKDVDEQTKVTPRPPKKLDKETDWSQHVDSYNRRFYSEVEKTTLQQGVTDR